MNQLIFSLIIQLFCSSAIDTTVIWWWIICTAVPLVWALKDVREPPSSASTRLVVNTQALLRLFIRQTILQADIKNNQPFLYSSTVLLFDVPSRLLVVGCCAMLVGTCYLYRRRPLEQIRQHGLNCLGFQAFNFSTTICSLDCIGINTVVKYESFISLWWNRRCRYPKGMSLKLEIWVVKSYHNVYIYPMEKWAILFRSLLEIRAPRGNIFWQDVTRID